MGWHVGRGAVENSVACAIGDPLLHYEHIAFFDAIGDVQQNRQERGACVPFLPGYT